MPTIFGPHSMALMVWQPLPVAPLQFPVVQAAGPSAPAVMYDLVQQIRAVRSTSRASLVADVDGGVPVFVSKGTSASAARSVAAAEAQFSTVLQRNFGAVMPDHRHRLDEWHSKELNLFVTDVNVDNAYYVTAGAGGQLVIPQGVAGCKELVLHELVHAYDAHLTLADAQPYLTDRALMNFELTKATAGHAMGKLMTPAETSTVGLEMFYNVNMRFATLTPAARYMLGGNVTREVLRARFPYTFGFFNRYYRGLDDVLDYRPGSIREVTISRPGWFSPAAVTETRVPAGAFSPTPASANRSRAGWEAADAGFAEFNLPLVVAANKAGYRRSHSERPFRLSDSNRELLAFLAQPRAAHVPGVHQRLGGLLITLGAAGTAAVAVAANQERLQVARYSLGRCEELASELGDLVDRGTRLVLTRARRVLYARVVLMFPNVWGPELAELAGTLREQVNLKRAKLWR